MYNRYVMLADDGIVVPADEYPLGMFAYVSKLRFELSCLRFKAEIIFIRAPVFAFAGVERALMSERLPEAETTFVNLG